MRKRSYTRNVGVLLTEDIYLQLINATDQLEVTISEYIRDLIENKLNKTQKEKNQDE
jgi:hypothetical protein